VQRGWTKDTQSNEGREMTEAEKGSTATQNDPEAVNVTVNDLLLKIGGLVVELDIARHQIASLIERLQEKP